MKRLRIYLIIVSILIVLVSLIAYIYHWEYRKPVLEIYFFSLNKGRSIFIRTSDNKTVLIGGGQNTEIIREITKITPFYNRSINTVIIPSATANQIGGLIDVIRRYNVDEILIPKTVSTSTVLDELQKEINKQKIHIKEIEKGDEFYIGNDLKIDVLFPYQGFKFNRTSLPELGLSILYGSTKAYLLGNLSKTIQKDISKYIVSSNDQNIIEFYNNAGESKVSTELMEKIKPKFIWSTKEKTMHIVSDGEKWILHN